MMKIKSIVVLFFLIAGLNKNVQAQGTPPASGSSMAAGRNEAVPVNYYTGIPSISLPLFNYAHPNGIGINLSLDYFAGGIKVSESPSAAGLGWNISTGGVITRTVRGLPDDLPFKGFFYSPPVPADVRNLNTYYYMGNRDAEQDVFQFNIGGRSGKFYFGKDSQIVMVPLSKMRIQCTKRYVEDDIIPVGPVTCTIEKFTVTTEDGIRYIFNEIEFQTSGDVQYGSAWYLSTILSTSGRDSIKIAYTSLSSARVFDWNQTATIAGVNISHSDTVYNNGVGFSGLYNQLPAKVPVEITLPDYKKVSFYYSSQGQFRHSQYPLLQRIKISDSVFRYGYMLNWDTTALGSNSRDFLTGLNYYTENAIKPGYKFSYNTPYFTLLPQVCTTFNGIFNCVTDTSNNSFNKKDHWGYYNGANNSRETVPTIPGIYTGANREPTSYAVGSSLSSVKDPAGGITYYQFENNDVYPYTESKSSIYFNAAQNTQSGLQLFRVLGTRTYFTIKYDESRVGATPISGGGKLAIQLTEISGNTVYTSDTINLQELYYSSSLSFSCSIAPGMYYFRTNLVAGTSSSSQLPVTVSWYNQFVSSGTGNLTGGIRIKQIRHYDPFTAKTDTLATYRYLTTDGKSSGFLGKKPVNHYMYYHVNNATYDTRLQSHVLNDLDFAAGSAIGYSRVEIIKGSDSNNLGKQVYEYTGVNEQDFDNSPSEYPFFPQIQKDWAWGLPKRVSMYDKTGRLIQSTTNTYQFTSKDYFGDTLFCSFKTGKLTDGNNIDAYRGKKYYPVSGRADLTSTADTLYHPDNSISSTLKSVAYDTNYNVIKTITPYDINKGLNLETRIYYPYNYTIGGTIGALRDSSIFVPVSTETWITGDANPRIIFASITAFSESITGFLKKLASPKPNLFYSLQTIAPVPQGIIGSFNPASLVRDTNFFKLQQSLLWNGQTGQVLQTVNALSGTTSTNVYGYNNTRLVAKVTNAAYSDVGYTSFESNTTAPFTLTSVARDSSAAITGKYSYDLNNGFISKTGLSTDITYFITYWTKGSAYVNGGTQVILTDQRNGWNLYTQKITGVSSIDIYGSGLIDELRIYPENANMASTTYYPNGAVSSECDANSNIIYYEYDVVNRIKVVRDKDRNVLKKYEYSDSLTYINLNANWVAANSTQWKCETDAVGNTGNVLRYETDMNPYSDTYLSFRYVFDHIDQNLCPIPPPSCTQSPDIKLVNGVCEIGCRINTTSRWSTVYINGEYVYRWACYYHYRWSDNTVSETNTEYNTYSCTLGNQCGGGGIEDY